MKKAKTLSDSAAFSAWRVVRGMAAVGRHAAGRSLSRATWAVSRKVAIGVFPYPLAPRAVHPIPDRPAHRRRTRRCRKGPRRHPHPQTITPPTSPSRACATAPATPITCANSMALIDIEKEDWAKSMHRLLERAHRATRFARENGRDVPTSLVARISRAWARILDHAIAFHEAQPPLRTGKRGRKKRRIGHNLALRLPQAQGGIPAISSPTRARRLRTMRPNVTSEWPSCARRSPVASAPRGVPTTSPECVPSSPPPRKQGWNVLQTLVRPDPMQTNPPTAPLRTPAPLPARTATIPHIQTLGAIRTWVVTVTERIPVSKDSGYSRQLVLARPGGASHHAGPILRPQG